MRKFALVAISVLFVAQGPAEMPIAVSGQYQYRTDADSKHIIGDYICFFPDADSVPLLPRPHGDTRLVWFCFLDTEQAKRTFGLSALKLKQCGVAASATVKIIQYTPYRGEGDGFDTAHLVSASGVGKPNQLACK